VVVALVALGVWAALHIIIKESQATMSIQARANGANTDNLNFLEGLLNIAPFVVLASAAIFIWTTAAASGGQ